MIAEKPSWVRHEGMQIFSIDVQPGGLRFATGGGDHKVWFFFSFDPFNVLLLLFEFQFEGILNFSDWMEYFFYVILCSYCCLSNEKEALF